jgi:hypothetical protein
VPVVVNVEDFVLQQTPHMRWLPASLQAAERSAFSVGGEQAAATTATSAVIESETMIFIVGS